MSWRGIPQTKSGEQHSPRRALPRPPPAAEAAADERRARARIAERQQQAELEREREARSPARQATQAALSLGGAGIGLGIGKMLASKVDKRHREAVARANAELGRLAKVAAPVLKNDGTLTQAGRTGQATLRGLVRAPDRARLLRARGPLALGTVAVLAGESSYARFGPVTTTATPNNAPQSPLAAPAPPRPRAAGSGLVLRPRQ